MKKVLRSLFYVTFAIYCIVLLCLLLLNRPSFFVAEQDLSEYARHTVNLIPFKTLSELFQRNAEHSINSDIVFDNAVGNFLLFFPMGIYLPCAFKKARKFPFFIMLIFLGVLLIEALQLVCRVGSFDVDDIMLNVSGAAAGFGLFRIRTVQRMLKVIQFLRI